MSKNGAFPIHGDEYEEDEDDAGESENEGENEGQEEQDSQKKRQETIEERLARLEGENAALRAGLSRPQPTPAPRAEPEPEPDWEKLMFDDPKKFVGELSGRISKQVVTDLGGKYQKDQGEKDFWREFYDEHDDLKEDRDLVQATLNSNIAALGDLPVSQAKKKLADLTRERILRYTGKQEKNDKGKKARVEGVGSPKTPQKQPEPPKVVTLSDLLKARRANRAKKAQIA